jgi:hypothetical protein
VQILLAIIPLIAFLATTVLIHGLRSAEAGVARREAVLIAAIVLGMVTAGATELLGLAHAIGFWSVLAVWLGAALVAGAGVGLMHRRGALGGWLAAPAGGLSGGEVSLVVILIGVFATVAFVALAAAPNNFDSMTYHLPRVEHWIQNRSLAFYPVHAEQQLIASPLAEIVVMHLRLLSGGDQLANMVQWASWLGATMGASLIAARLRLGRRGQLAAATLTATLPMAILQGSSTQTDLAAAFWFVTFVYFLLCYRAQGRRADLAWMALALGLGLYAKGTLYFFAFPLCLWGGVIMIHRLGWRGLGAGLAVAGMVLAINAGHYLRNLDLYGHPLGASESYRGIHGVTAPGLRPTVSILSRNLANHFKTPSPAFNARLEAWVAALHDWIGLDVSDPDTTYPDRSFTVPTFTRTMFTVLNEDFAGNPLHILLAGLALLALAGALARRRTAAPAEYRLALAYGAVSLSGFLIFCALVRWNAWQTRLDLPLFFAIAPIVALALERWFKARLTVPICLGLYVLAAPLLLTNSLRPLAPAAWSNIPGILSTDREAEYFTRYPHWRAPYARAVGFVARSTCRDIGLSLTSDQNWEYPIWALARQAGLADLRLQHLDVANGSAAKIEAPPYDAFRPCAVIAVRYDSLPAAITVRGARYRLGEDSELVGVYLPDGPAVASHDKQD